MALLEVHFEFDDHGKIIKVNWSDGSYDSWTYHELSPWEEKQLAKGKKLPPERINQIGKEDKKYQSDGTVLLILYDKEGNQVGVKDITPLL